MKVWIVTDCWDYDSETVLGVYSSEEKAAYAREQYAQTAQLRPSHYSIDVFVVDELTEGKQTA